MIFNELLTDVLVPIASPLIAAIAIVVAIRAEGRKVRLQRLNEHRLRIDSIFTDALYARDMFTILVYQSGSGRLTPDLVGEFQATTDRFFDKIFSDPEAGRRLYDEVQFIGKHNNIFRILSELRIRIARMELTKKLDMFIYFGLTTLLFLYDSDKDRRDDMYRELEKVRDTDTSLYGVLMVDKSTKSLRSCA